jgi:undecaprenyl-diphosphatase
LKDIIMGLIYGLISGFSELFPISASAHNILFTMFSGFTIPLLWRVTCHLGALLALLFFYRHQLKHMQREMRIASQKKHRRMRHPDMAAVADGKMMMAASFPMALGLLAATQLSSLVQKLWLMSALLIINGILLYVPQYLQLGTKRSLSMGPADSLIFGLGNALSCLPGISGIGCVLLAGCRRGTEKTYILDIAMLLMIPWLLGSMVIDLLAMIGAAQFSLLILISAVLCCAASFGAAYAAVGLMRYLAVRIGFHCFAYYSWGAGFVCLILYLMI